MTSQLLTGKDAAHLVPLNSWSFDCLFGNQDETYDPKLDLQKLSIEAVEVLVEHGAGCPLGEIAKLELLKRQDRIVDWHFSGFRDGSIDSTVRLKNPLHYIKLDFTLGSLEDANEGVVGSKPFRG